MHRPLSPDVAPRRLSRPRAGGQTIPLVSGFDWAYGLTPQREEPIAAARLSLRVRGFNTVT